MPQSDYFVLQESASNFRAAIEHLEPRANKALSHGYKLAGGISTSVKSDGSTNTYLVFQALYKSAD